MIVTLGNEPSGEDGAIICAMQADGTLTHEFTMSEQGNHNIALTMPTGEIVIGGADAALGDDWTFGNIYVKAGGTWQKKRTLPNVLHVFGQTIHNGKLYVGTGAHTGDNATWEARVFWSDDIGDTWNSSYVCYYRVRDLISFNGILYAVCWEWPDFTFYRSEDDGVTWIKMTEIVPDQYPRMVIYNSKLHVVDSGRCSLSVIDGTGAVGRLQLPETIPNQTGVRNFMTVADGNLYVLLGADADHVWRYDGAWQYYCDLAEPCCSLLNFEDSFLIASTIGVDAKLLKIPV